MPRIIFRCPYLKGGTEAAAAHLENYISYMATRKGVERIDPGRTLLPATAKQKAMVERLLRDFPLSRGTFEYEDLLAAPTRGNASEFIRRAIEDNLDSLAKRENYLKYIAQRPRAQRMGPHGLFTGAEDALVLSHVAEAVAEHPGNVWLPIISLRREDAARLGYDNAECWRALLSSYAVEMAEAMKIPSDQFRWYAAYHDEGHHPHVHMVCYSTDPSKGFLTKKGIAKIRSDLAKQIFRQELTELYTRQTKSREELNAQARSALEELIHQMYGGELVNDRIEQLITYLAGRLKNTTGKKQYGYLKAPLKSVVDEIVDELAKDSRVAEAYRLWYELRDEVLRTYRSDLPEQLPLSQQKEFKKIKNMVIREALRLGELEQAPDEPPMLEEAHDPFPEEDAFAQDGHALPDSPPSEDGEWEEPLPGERTDVVPTISWSDRYKLARQYLYGGEHQPPDTEGAYALFLDEARSGNALAMHDLGRMWMDGLAPGGEIDTQQAQAWYAKALTAFLTLEKEKADRYTEYRIGKLYAMGYGTDQDYMAAADWFARAAGKGHKYAQYSMAGLYSRGQGVEQDHTEAHRLYTASAGQGFPYAAFELGKQFRNGVGCEADVEAAKMWSTSAYEGFRTLEKQSHDDKLQYRIGWMLLHGVGAEQDEQEARIWFEKAARLGNPQAQYQLAKLMLADPAATANQVAEAIAWFTKAADQGNQYAQYALGKLYLKGDGIPKDVTAALRWLEAAAEQKNSFAEYALGVLYFKGEDTPRDMGKALGLLTRSAEQGNQYAQYRLGRLLLSGEGIPKNVEMAVWWLTASAEQGNQFSQYTLGKLYLLGKDAPRDKETATRWFALAAEQGNEYAQYFLDHMDDPYGPTLFQSATQLLHYLSGIFREQEPPPSRSGGMRIAVDKKLLRKIREKKMAQGHKGDDHEAQMTL